jgi:hypothetical protein
MMGVIISSAVLPATLTLIWSGQNKWAASLSPILGLVCALIGWLVMAKKECGDLSVHCTGSNNPMLVGNVVALLSPVVFVPILTLVFGVDKYDWKSMLDIRKGDDHDLADAVGMDLEDVPGGHTETELEFEEEQRKLLRAGKISKTTTVVMTLILLVLWPMPLYGSGYIFSKQFFTGWVVVGIIWIFCSFIGVGLFPIFEGRKTLASTFRFVFLDLSGKSHPKTIHAQAAVVETTPGDSTPPEKTATKEEISGS